MSGHLLQKARVWSLGHGGEVHRRAQVAGADEEVDALTVVALQRDQHLIDIGFGSEDALTTDCSQAIL
jgi:hypothetical protein